MWQFFFTLKRFIILYQLVLSSILFFPIATKCGGGAHVHICLFIIMTRIIAFQIITPPISEKVSTFLCNFGFDGGIHIFWGESKTAECTKLFHNYSLVVFTNALHFFSKGSDVKCGFRERKSDQEENMKFITSIKFWCLWLMCILRCDSFCSTKFSYALFSISFCGIMGTWLKQK